MGGGEEVKLYTGVRDSTPRCTVNVTDGDTTKELRANPARSPAGFEWGYYGATGTGSTELASVILADLAGQEVAQQMRDKFASDVILKLSRTYWRLTETDIRQWLRQNTLQKVSV